MYVFLKTIYLSTKVSKFLRTDILKEKKGGEQTRIIMIRILASFFIK